MASQSQPAISLRVCEVVFCQLNRRFFVKPVPARLALRRSEKVMVDGRSLAEWVAERWMGSCRRDLLDHIIAVNERHLQRLLTSMFAITTTTGFTWG
jgi:hypothetical protein